MEVCPDFGYEGDNFLIEREEGSPKNWKLMSEVISSKRNQHYIPLTYHTIYFSNKVDIK